MTRQRRIDTAIYTVADFLSAMVAWTCFFLWRKWAIEGVATGDFSVLANPKFGTGVLIIPLGWVLFYAIFDKYQDIYRLSRLATIARTFFLSFFGAHFSFRFWVYKKLTQQLLWDRVLK